MPAGLFEDEDDFLQLPKDDARKGACKPVTIARAPSVMAAIASNQQFKQQFDFFKAQFPPSKQCQKERRAQCVSFHPQIAKLCKDIMLKMTVGHHCDCMKNNMEGIPELASCSLFGMLGNNQWCNLEYMGMHNVRYFHRDENRNQDQRIIVF